MTSRRSLLSMDLDDIGDDSPLFPQEKIGLDRELSSPETPSDLAAVGQGGLTDLPSSFVMEDAIPEARPPASVFDLSDYEAEELSLSKAAQERLRRTAEGDGFRNSRPVRYGRPPTGRTAGLHVRIRPELLDAFSAHRHQEGEAANIAVERALCVYLGIDYDTLQPLNQRR